MCYGMLRAAACVDESDHHALMYVWHGQTVREDRAAMLQPLMLRLTRKAAAFRVGAAAARPGPTRYTNDMFITVGPTKKL